MAETGHSFIKKFLGFSLSTWVSFIIGFIATPISTRLFDPDVHGKISIFNTYSNLFGILVLIGLDQAFARFYHERPNNKSLRYLFTFCLSATYALIFVLGVLAIPFRDWLSMTIFQEEDNLLLILFFLSAFCQSTIRYLNLIYRMEQNIKMFTIQGILNAIVSRLLYIMVGFWNPSYRYALIALIASQLLLSISFLFIQRSRFTMLDGIDRVFSKEVFAFALPLIPVSILTWANSSIPNLVMQRTMDYYSIGIFSSAMTLANLILVVQQGFNSFWVPYTYENYKTQNGQFYKVHRYLVCMLTVVALLIVCSQDIIFLLLGSKYRAAKVFFPFLLLGPVCYVLGEVAGLGIDISKKTYYKIYVFIASIVVNIFFCLTLQKPFGIVGVAIATSLAAIVSMVIKTIIGERYYKMLESYKYLFSCVLFIVVSAIITWLCDNMIVKTCLLSALLLTSIFYYRIEIKDLWKYLITFFQKP